MDNQNSLFRIPLATYRLQLSQQFTLNQANEVVEYLNDLGITDCYLSPILKAKAGTTHGYDVVDYSQLNPEIGTESDLSKFSQTLKNLDMGLLLDIVPNHMCIMDDHNVWWNDVLENGPSSPYSGYFNINWTPPKKEITNKILLPVLGNQFGKSLENQEIKISFLNGEFFVNCNNKHFKMDLSSWSYILEPIENKIENESSKVEANDFDELKSIITALCYLPAVNNTDSKKIKERQREKEIIKKRLNELTKHSSIIEKYIVDELNSVNGIPGKPESFDRLEHILKRQPYRLSFWRIANDELNYRRFFDINEYAGICVEKFEVFFKVHEYILRLINQGYITGLRIDHIDGLYDPLKYLKNLQKATLLASQDKIEDFETTKKKIAEIKNGKYFYTIVEKILIKDETLRQNWPVDGTTGYEFLNDLNGIFIDNFEGIINIYSKFVGNATDVSYLTYQCKVIMLKSSLGSDLSTLAVHLGKIAEHYRWSRDFSLESLRIPLRDVIACFPVYRTYISDRKVSDLDRDYILQAINQAKSLNPATNAVVFDFIKTVLLLEYPEGLDEQKQGEWIDFVMHFQQLTGPVMAKGVEDTEFYRFYPLGSFTEVGTNIEATVFSKDQFHNKMLERSKNWPHAISTTSTHDTKHGEDARARLNVLSEIPEEWSNAINVWHNLNFSKKTKGRKSEIPDRNEEYLLYQTLVSTWPLYPMDAAALAQYTDRITLYMNKALKEAKLHTSWVNANEEYDQAVKNFIKDILNLHEKNQFIIQFTEFMQKIMKLGMLNSLCQLVLKLTCPGVPDFYQGDELWDFSLVDPDNRHPIVDFSFRKTLIENLKEIDEEEERLELINHLMKSPEDGRVKIYIIMKLLGYRKLNQNLFLEGTYSSLTINGPRENHILAFSRKDNNKELIIVISRFFSKILQFDDGYESLGWENNYIEVQEEGSYQDILTNIKTSTIKNGSIQLSCEGLFTHLPFAILERN